MIIINILYEEGDNMNTNIVGMHKEIKDNIEHLISSNCIDDAKELINEYEKIDNRDIDIINMKGIVYMMEGCYDKALDLLIQGYSMNPDNFDIIYNLAYAYEMNGDINNSFIMYNEASEKCFEDNQKSEVLEIIKRIKEKNPNIVNKKRNKIVFFHKSGMDSFLGDIINNLSLTYEVKKVEVTNYNQIDAGMKWADICWFEWCDELIAYGSKHRLANEKKIVCRLHSYEAFTEYPDDVNWSSVDKLIFVAEHIRDLVLSKFSIENSITTIIHNGIDLNKYNYKERKPGFDVAYLGYINYKKGPMILLHTFKALYDKDHRYKLHIAGKFQDDRDILYFNQMVKELGIANNVFFDGWQTDVYKWLSDKQYILCTSVLEGNPVGIMEAMAEGMKPIIHNFVGARKLYPDKYIWNTVDEAVKLIRSSEYNSKEYREFISNNFSLEGQISLIKNEIDNIALNNKIEKSEDQYNRINALIDNNRKLKEFEDITIVIPTYNRASMLKKGIKEGHFLGKQKKIIIDDFSNKENQAIINEIRNNINDDIKKIILNETNSGVAVSINKGISTVDTQYTILCGDDDMILCSDLNGFSEKVTNITDDIIVIPRYIKNLDDDNDIQIGYDRNELNGCNALQLLEYIFSTGEMFAFNAAAIFNSKTLQDNLPDSIFRVSEDYVLLSRVLGNNTNIKVLVLDEYEYIRRVSNQSLSKTINRSKLTIHLVSLIISGYYCYKNNLYTMKEIKEAINKRGKLIQDIYGFGKSITDDIIQYLDKEIDINGFWSGIITKGGLPESCRDNIPFEIINIIK